MPSIRERVTAWWRGTSTLALASADPPAARPAVGEQGLADEPMRQVPTAMGQSWWPTYSVGIDTQPNYAKCRALFYNRLPPYRLGAGFSKPIINATSGFVGVPTPSTAEDNPEATEALQDQWDRWQARLYLATRNSLRDGDAFVRLGRAKDRLDPRRSTFTLRLLRPDRVFPIPNPFTGEWEAVDLHHYINPPQDSPIKEPYLLIEHVTPEATNIRLAEGQQAPPEARDTWGGEGLTEANPWKLIPIVQLRNEAEEDAQWGTSDLEALDPLFRAYHDTLLLGLGGIQLFAKPKIKLHVRDRVEFLRQNFPEALAGRPINFQGREVILLTEGEDALYITADPGTQGVQTLLELVFYQIVQVSETPEFVFGTAVASSKASVSEQQVPFAKKIDRKRLQLNEPMHEIASMYLAMAASVNVVPALESYATDLDWPEVSPRDETSIATTIKTLVDAFVAGVQAGLIGAESAAEFLRSFVPSMLEWHNDQEPMDEQRRIKDGLDFIDQAVGSAGPTSAEALALLAGRSNGTTTPPNGRTNGAVPPPNTNGTTTPPVAA